MQESVEVTSPASQGAVGLRTRAGQAGGDGKGGLGRELPGELSPETHFALGEEMTKRWTMAVDGGRTSAQRCLSRRKLGQEDA